MQETHSSNPSMVTGIWDSKKYPAHHHCNKYLDMHWDFYTNVCESIGTAL